MCISSSRRRAGATCIAPPGNAPHSDSLTRRHGGRRKHGMTERRMRVGVIYGGRSGEHEISLRSAASIIAALDPTRYEVIPVGITKDGRWLTGTDSLRILEAAQR